MKLIKYFLALALQLAGMLVAAYIAYNTRWLSEALYIVCAWVLLPLAGAVSACLVTAKGVNNYLAWISPPAAGIVAYYLSFFYMPDSAGQIITCAIASIVGAAVGDVSKKYKRK